MDTVGCAAASHNAISRLGGGFMVAPSVTRAADRLGLSFLELYIAGRAGVMGAVSAREAAEALGIINPEMVRSCWVSATAKVAPLTAAQAYADCCSDWGRERFAGVAVAAPAAELVLRVVQALDLAELPLVAGWRALPLPDDAEGRLAQLLQTLREYRGALHVQAITAAGLAPVEAIVSGPDGAERAGQLGWPPPYPDPAGFTAARRLAEADTNERASAQFEALTAQERALLVGYLSELMQAAHSKRPALH